MGFFRKAGRFFSRAGRATKKHAPKILAAADALDDILLGNRFDLEGMRRAVAQLDPDNMTIADALRFAAAGARLAGAAGVEGRIRGMLTGLEVAPRMVRQEAERQQMNPTAVQMAQWGSELTLKLIGGKNDTD